MPSTAHYSPTPGSLYLASGSPRRRQLLDEAEIPFQVVPTGLDDAMLRPGRVTPAQWAVSLAYLKARSGWEHLPESARGQARVLGADTIVVKDGQLIGQPRSADDACAMIRLLQNGPHRVVTGVALLDTSGRTLFCDTSDVRVGPIDDADITRYVASGAWRGKAGAYNLSERIDDGWPISYTGDPATIMGLPMQRLAPHFQRLSPTAPHH